MQDEATLTVIAMLVWKREAPLLQGNTIVSSSLKPEVSICSISIGVRNSEAPILHLREKSFIVNVSSFDKH